MYFVLRNELFTIPKLQSYCKVFLRLLQNLAYFREFTWFNQWEREWSSVRNALQSLELTADRSLLGQLVFQQVLLEPATCSCSMKRIFAKLEIEELCCKLFHISQSSSISSLAKTSFMEQKHAAGSRRTCWNTSWPRRVLSAVKFQRLYESARFSLKTILSPIDYNHVCLVED